MLEEVDVPPEEVSPGDEVAARVDPCENHKCRRGRCKPRRKADGATDYKCRCRTGWSGRFCDQGEAHAQGINFFFFLCRLIVPVGCLLYLEVHSGYTLTISFTGYIQ